MKVSDGASPNRGTPRFACLALCTATVTRLSAPELAAGGRWYGGVCIVAQRVSVRSSRSRQLEQTGLFAMWQAARLADQFFDDRFDTEDPRACTGL